MRQCPDYTAEHNQTCIDLHNELLNLAASTYLRSQRGGETCVTCRAYTQGRNDIANDIRTTLEPFYDSPNGKYLAPLMSKLRRVLDGIDANI